MKRKRIILVFDYDDSQAAALRLMLRTKHYEVMSCFSEAERVAKMKRWPIDLLIVHEPMATCDYAGPLPVIHLPREYRPVGWAQQLAWDVHMALIRKRGAKSVSSFQLPVSSERRQA